MSTWVAAPLYWPPLCLCADLSFNHNIQQICSRYLYLYLTVEYAYNDHFNQRRIQFIDSTCIQYVRKL